MTDIVQDFAASASALAGLSGLAGLANGASATSDAVEPALSGGAGYYVDALVEAVITAGASGVSATGTVELWAKASIDASDFDDDANDRLVGILTVNANGTTFKKSGLSVAASFGGVLPPAFKLRVKNASGAALAASGSALAWRGVKGRI
jgi:hypothetical protein